jgi:hypothetical protein
MDRLSEAELARMRAEHVSKCTDLCKEYGEHDDYCPECEIDWPCDAARLLHDYAPGPVPHLAGIIDAHCHCGAQGMETSHPRHAPTPEQQVAIANGLFGFSGERGQS